MKKKYKDSDIIHLSDIAKVIWKEKILIFLISSIILIIASFYSVNSIDSRYIFKIKFRSLASYAIEKFNVYIEKPTYKVIEQDDPLDKLILEFNKEFLVNITSLNYILDFMKLNKQNYDFNYDDDYIKDFFKGSMKISSERKEHLPNEYTLVIEKSLLKNKKLTLDEKFLDDYVIYVQTRTFELIRNKIIQKISNNISLYKHHLEIAEQIGLREPILKFFEGKTVINEPDALFYKGSVVLNQQIMYFQQSFSTIKDLELEFNPILLEASKEIKSSSNIIKILSVAILLASFLSFLIILVKYSIKKSN